MSHTTRQRGRPKKVDGPALPYHEIDTLLVHGEIVKDGAGENPIHVYPSYREIAQRYGVSHSLIVSYVKRKDCKRRRAEIEGRVQAKVDEKVIAALAKTKAVSTEHEIRIIDTYIRGFAKAMEEGKVRFDDPNHLNTMVRLKHFMLGGPDSRKEIRGLPTLEEMQRRHKEMLKRMEESTPEMCGVVVNVDARKQTTDPTRGSSLRIVPGGKQPVQRELAEGNDVDGDDRDESSVEAEYADTVDEILLQAEGETASPNPPKTYLTNCPECGASL